MTVTTDAPGASPSWSADELHALADMLVEADATTDQPVLLLDQLDALERIKSAAAAAQVALAAAFSDAVEAVEDAPADGRRRPPRAMSIGAEVAHLDPAERAGVDADLAGTVEKLAGLGDEKLRLAVRRSCLAIAADAEARRYRRAREDRHVTTRQLHDGTGRITAIVTAEHLAAVRAVLDEESAAARATGDERTAGQLRADVLVHRLTGHDPVDPLAVRVNLVVSAESLIGSCDDPAQVPGIGWLPAALCTGLVREASAAAKATLRRLFVRPDDRALVAMESHSRTFPTALGEFLDLRDGGLCRTPGCNAVIRHHDHVLRESDGGPTSADNGQGLCERCNYVKETPGWTSWVARADPGRHEVHGVTEHLRILRSTAPPLPGCGSTDYSPDFSPAELRLAQALTLAA